MKRFLLFLIFAIVCSGYAIAYDFSAVCESGQTLYYTITSNSSPFTVKVTYPNYNSSIEEYYYNNTKPTGDLEIPESVEYNSITYSVTSIGNNAFYYCSLLTSVTIPNSVTCIGERAFVHCSGLTSAPISNSVTSIGRYAFSSCSGLSSVAIPNSVTSIGYGAFYGCSWLTEMTIPFVGGSVTPTEASESTLFGYIFGYTTSSDQPTGTTRQYYAHNSTSYIYAYIPNYLRSVTITGGVLQYGAFYGCSMLRSVTIGNSVTSIGDEAFSGCSRLATVNYNATNCTSVGMSGNSAFYRCSSLTTLNIGPNVTCIPNNAFNGCRELTGTLTIPNSVTSIGIGAFRDCSGLTSVKIPNSVESIGVSAFYNCSSLTGTLTIPNSITSIGVGVFHSCESLTLVEIPNSVESIGISAFAGCSGLISLTIPNSVMSIDYDAFYGCASLTDIYLKATTPPSVHNISFNNYTATLWVPCGYSEIYASATGWSSFSNIRENRAYMLNISSANPQQGTTTVTQQPDCINGIAVISATPVEHYNFIQWNDGNTDNPRTVIVENDTTYIAVFAIDQHTITVESADEAMGTVSESNTYDYGTEIQISATAAEHYHFVQWSDGNTDNPRTITVTEDATYRASFAADSFTITVVSDDETMGTVSEGGTFPYGTEIQISATPRDTYIYGFVGWNDGNTDNPRTITVVADATYIASFVSVTGIEVSSAFEISLFPNPANDILNITSSETISEIEIVNTLGQVVRRIEVNSDNAVCDVEELKAGVYVVRISTASATLSQQRFIKE